MPDGGLPVDADHLHDRDGPRQQRHARPLPGAFRLIVAELGVGLGGPPWRPRRVILARASGAGARGSETLQILGKLDVEDDWFLRLHSGTRYTVIGALENLKQDVVRFVHQAGRTA